MNQSPDNPTQTQPPSEKSGGFTPRVRATPLHARGEPMVWLTGSALVMCLLMIVGLLSLVLYHGGRAFWPGEVKQVTFAPVGEDGKPGANPTVVLGVQTEEEFFDPGEADQKAIAAMKKAGTLPAGAVDSAGRAARKLLRVGNRELQDQPFLWVPLYQIQNVETPAEATMVERMEWGPWFGVPAGVEIRQRLTIDQPAAKIELSLTRDGEHGKETVARTIVGPAEGKPGSTVVDEVRVIGKDEPARAMAVFQKLWPEARARAAEIERLKEIEVGRINHEIEAQRLRVRQAEVDFARAKAAFETGAPSAPVWMWWVGVFAAAGLLGAWVFTRPKPPAPGELLIPKPSITALRAVMLAGVVALAVFAYVERPNSLLRADQQTVERLSQRLESTRAEAKTKNENLEAKYGELRSQTAKIDEEDARYRVIFREVTTGKFAPVRQTELGEPLRISQVVRTIQPNGAGVIDKLSVYTSRWGEFIFGAPREANTEGGIFPVIIGTVTLTLLLSVLVMPLGVIAAIYLREYAKQGPLTSAVRVAINNLAGVPSIVYGVFGLGFFCYSVGAFIDTGSGVSAASKVSLPVVGSVWATVAWWIGVGVLLLLVLGAVFASMAARPRPGQHATNSQVWLARGAAIGWVLCAASLAGLVAYTPYFNGFFEANLPAKTFNAKGMLWSALTLALLTLPVVIVATEEAIAAVPRTMREGSYGCGASKWQTIQRIVLPRAMPGIMTGMILAMARGAGEVAPLMLVGAVKLAPELPISSQWPFLHLDRNFMHLGFHVYDVGFQSPDSQAAQPIVWCTTFLLILVVVTLNASAISIRSSLRKKFFGETF
jgi:phosphate transport system permease protein